MTESVKNKVNYIESKGQNLRGPIFFLVLVILISAGLFAYNIYLQKQKADLDIETGEKQKMIAELTNKAEIQVYSLLDNNKSTIDELEKRSRITTYIEHLKSLSPENKYGIKFEGFNLAEGRITTSAIVEGTNNNDKIAYKKTRDFIRNYRTDSGALLDLEFINLVEGSDIMKFNVSFKIK